MVRDILVQERRNQEAAERFLRLVVADKLGSYTPAIRKVLPRAERRAHEGLNNRAESSHRPTRQREGRMRRLKSPDQGQRFLEPFGPIYDHCCPRRHLLGAAASRQESARRHMIWREISPVAS
jgi:putative transposase